MQKLVSSFTFYSFGIVHNVLLFSLAISKLLWTLIIYSFVQAVISKEDFGVLGPDDNCWPQMACMIPTSDDKVFEA